MIIRELNTKISKKIVRGDGHKILLKNGEPIRPTLITVANLNILYQFLFIEKNENIITRLIITCRTGVGIVWCFIKKDALKHKSAFQWQAIHCRIRASQGKLLTKFDGFQPIFIIFNGDIIMLEDRTYPWGTIRQNGSIARGIP
ncbi:MAG TPA: hypothetical protein VK971_08045 [Thiohalobacter sp.]|nr:hypothetical protein [Thiohalobacter sp.]